MRRVVGIGALSAICVSLLHRVGVQAAKGDSSGAVVFAVLAVGIAIGIMMFSRER
jgi:hypothetical protein